MSLSFPERLWRAFLFPGSFSVGTASAFVPALVLVAFLFSGCTSTPPPVPQKTVHPDVTEARFHADRQKRRVWLNQWQVSGILELTTEDTRRRFRASMRGEGASRAKVRILGAMRQVMMDLFSGPQAIRLVNPEKRQIVEVPATSEGLAYLLAIGLPPRKLFEAITALADALAQRDLSTQNAWFTREGEQLVLDPETGLIQARFGRMEKGGSYHVLYQWDESVGLRAAKKPENQEPENQEPVNQEPENQDGRVSGASVDFLRMPTHIQVILEPGETQIKYKVKQWTLPDKPFVAHWFSATELYSGFSLVRPGDRSLEP